MKTEFIGMQNRRPGGWDNYFTVSGGPFTKSQQWGWYLTDDKGRSLAVSPDMGFAKFCVESLKLKKLLEAHGKTLMYRLQDQRDQGYLDDISSDDWEELTSAMELAMSKEIKE